MIEMKNESPEQWSFFLREPFQFRKRRSLGELKKMTIQESKNTHTKKIQVGLIGITRKQDGK